MIIDIVIGFVVMLLIMAVWYCYIAPTPDLYDLRYYIPTNAEGCQLTHRHLWVRVGQFPEIITPPISIYDEITPYGGEYRYVSTYNCPVCEVNQMMPRVDTTTRHKGTYNHET